RPRARHRERVLRQLRLLPYQRRKASLVQRRQGREDTTERLLGGAGERGEFPVCGVVAAIYFRQQREVGIVPSLLELCAARGAEHQREGLGGGRGGRRQIGRASRKGEDAGPFVSIGFRRGKEGARKIEVVELFGTRWEWLEARRLGAQTARQQQ